MEEGFDNCTIFRNPEHLCVRKVQGSMCCNLSIHSFVLGMDIYIAATKWLLVQEHDE